MEPGTRKILPRIRPSSAGHGQGDVELAVEPARRREEEGGGGGHITNGGNEKYIINLKQWRPMYDEEGPPRKRQNIGNGRSQSQSLPGVQQLLTVPTDPEQVEAQMTTPCRLARNPQNGLYYNHGAFIFKSPSPPGLDFPRSISQDPRPFSFANVEPELMDIFKHAWYLRQYARSHRSHGREMWWDHKMINDCYGIDSVLFSWSSRYEPGTAQYPASMLYKTVLWLYFNRSIQPSMSTTSFRDVVDDGMHHLSMLERALGNIDRMFLLVPIFLLGASAFAQEQRGPIWRMLERIDPSYQTGATAHAMHVLDQIWNMMDDHRVGSTWDWERVQYPASMGGPLDRSLLELLQDPWVPVQPPPRMQSPEAQPEFDNSRFRAAPMPPPSVPPMPEGALNSRNSSGDNGHQTSSQGVSPTDASRPAPVREDSEHWSDTRRERTMSQPELAPGPPLPRPFLAPPPPTGFRMLTGNEMMGHSRSFSNKIPQVVKLKKSSVPPCHVCGKELKNPSDAQKHQLQHSKPFLCKEPGCLRIQGFATENDLQRHRKSVHGASPRIGNKTGYVCAECPEPSDGTPRKWWPRLDNFKAHIRRKHHGADEEALIMRSTAPRRQEDTYADSGYPHPGHPGSGETLTPTQSQSQYPMPSRERQSHQSSITSLNSDLDAREETQGQQQSQGPQYEDYDEEGESANGERGGAEREGDGEEDEREGEEEEADDRPVGPWELHAFFKKGRRRVEGEDDDVGEPGEDGQDMKKLEQEPKESGTRGALTAQENGSRESAGVEMAEREGAGVNGEREGSERARS